MLQQSYQRSLAALSDPLANREEFAINLRKQKKAEIMNLKRKKIFRSGDHYPQPSEDGLGLTDPLKFDLDIIDQEDLAQKFYQLDIMVANRSEDLQLVLGAIERIAEGCQEPEPN